MNLISKKRDLTSPVPFARMIYNSLYERKHIGGIYYVSKKNVRLGR